MGFGCALMCSIRFTASSIIARSHTFSRSLQEMAFSVWRSLRFIRIGLHVASHVLTCQCVRSPTACQHCPIKDESTLHPLQIA